MVLQIPFLIAPFCQSGMKAADLVTLQLIFVSEVSADAAHLFYSREVGHRNGWHILPVEQLVCEADGIATLDRYVFVRLQPLVIQVCPIAASLVRKQDFAVVKQ